MTTPTPQRKSRKGAFFLSALVLANALLLGAATRTASATGFERGYCSHCTKDDGTRYNCCPDCVSGKACNCTADTDC